jgi:hypothetical protein
MEMHHRKLNDLLMIMVWHLVHMEWMVKTNNDLFCFLSDGVTMELKEKEKEKKKQN